MIDSQKVQKVLAFTLAEILITMIVITLVTLASVPAIKKSREYRETTKDKNSWVALYEAPTGGGSPQLVVYENGVKKTGADYIGGSGSSQYAKFTPPEGISRFNVTVIGGGGGGAAGFGEKTTAKEYFAEGVDKVFVPQHDGRYQVVVIGGGGAGAGGSDLCTGRGGYAAEGVIAEVDLKKGQEYGVFVGIGGFGGKGKGLLTVIVDVASIIAGIIASIYCPPAGSAFLAGLGAVGGGVTGGMIGSTLNSLAGEVLHDDPEEGGGTGLPSSFAAVDGSVAITAKGGTGGRFRNWKLFGGCHQKGEPSNSGVTQTIGAASATKLEMKRQDKRDGGYICKGSSCTLSGLTSAIEIPASAFRFGTGGRGGALFDSGSNGQPGYVRINEIPVYGGGSGGAGAVSFYSYERSPLDKNSAEEFIKVYVGKGGDGGSPTAATEKDKNGKDGKFSRFGNRIIADGGLGGKQKAEGSVKDTSWITAKGANGASTAVGQNVLKTAKLPSGLVEVLYGGYQTSTYVMPENGEGHGEANTGGVTKNAVPGSGGGGGGARMPVSYGSPTVGRGGDGATGAVIVTW